MVQAWSEAAGKSASSKTRQGRLRRHFSDTVIAQRGHLNDAAHFKQARARARTDAFREGGTVIDLAGARAFVCDVAGVGIDQIRGGDQRFTEITARRDDGSTVSSTQSVTRCAPRSSRRSTSFSMATR